MKKFLSLVLALVMTMSLVTISAGAATFADDASITYDEAVEVIAALGVVSGYDDGSFAPKGNLTRGAAAKIICNMILGPTTAAELSADAAPFSDVPADHVFAGYIAYCVKEGIANGYTDGTFRPAAPLTGYAFMKMLLGALGYDPANEGYTGDNWSINVAKRALGIGLNAGLLSEFNGTKAVTREEAALYAFNTLKATMVEYEQETTVNFGNGQNITVSGPAQDLAWGTGTLNDGKVARDGFVQFAERYFSKLTGTPTTDAFGRPATAWTYNKKDIGTFVRKDLLTSVDTVALKGGDVYSVIGSVAADYALSYFVDGVELSKTATAAVAADLAKNNKDAMPSTGKGVLTEVYVDAETEETTIVVINTYLAKVTTDYSEKNESIRVGIYMTDDSNSETAKTVKLENVANCADFAKDDLVLVTLANGVVMSMADPEVVADVEISTFSTNDGTNTTTGERVTKITADGTKYEAAANANYDADVLNNYTDTLLDTNTFNLYLDPYGYVIGLDIVGSTTEYVFVTSYKCNSSVLSKVVDQATIITTEGEMKTVDIKRSTALKAKTAAQGDIEASTACVNAWYEYSMDGDVFVLEAKATNQLVDTNKAEISSTYTTLEKGASEFKFGNASSTYITVDVEADCGDAGCTINEWVEDVTSVTEGIKNVNLNVTGNVYALYNSKGYVTYAIVVGEDNTSSNSLVYVTSNAVIDKTYDKEVKCFVYTYECIINGEPTTVQVKANADMTGLANGDIAGHTLYKMTYDANGYAKKVEEVADTATADLNTAELKKGQADLAPIDSYLLMSSGATLYINDNKGNSKYFILDEECNFFVYNAQGEAKYVEFADVDAALNETGIKDANGMNKITGKIVIIADKNTGYATTVIVKDSTFEADEEIRNEATDNSIKVVINGTTITVTAPADATNVEKAEAIVAELTAKGYSAIDVDLASTGITGVAALKNSITYTFTIA